MSSEEGLTNSDEVSDDGFKASDMKNYAEGGNKEGIGEHENENSEETVIADEFQKNDDETIDTENTKLESILPKDGDVLENSESEAESVETNNESDKNEDLIVDIQGIRNSEVVVKNYLELIDAISSAPIGNTEDQVKIVIGGDIVVEKKLISMVVRIFC